MTEQLIEYTRFAPTTVPNDPSGYFLRLRALNLERDRLGNELDRLKTELAQNEIESRLLAETILRSGVLTDGEYTLSPTFKTKTALKIDANKLKTNHPDIYRKCNPYVMNNIVVDILAEQAGGKDMLYNLIKNINPEKFDTHSKIHAPEFRGLCKTLEAAEKFMLEEDGTIKTVVTTVGEPTLISAELADAYSAQHARELNRVEEDDDEEEEEYDE